MRRIGSMLLIVLGIGFVAWSVGGRYVVLPGFLESLESGTGAAGTVPDDVEAWRIVRFLLWAYSFKIGILLVTLAMLLRLGISRKRFATYSVIGLIYLSVAYAPMSAPGVVFGIVGTIMAVFIVLAIMGVPKARSAGSPFVSQRELQLGAYFFFATAAHMLCGFFGTRIFALEPERMIAYELQEDAMTFAVHILIELTVGWILLFLSHRVGAGVGAEGDSRPADRR
ncbi:MAG TPA: hypothetical protein PKE40_03540 [Arachnia sp.]|nr:hypothetical protein [Arachnia sp.]HMT85403.1 hypothetical protein [Arachnia sp.]